MDVDSSTNPSVSAPSTNWTSMIVDASGAGVWRSLSSFFAVIGGTACTSSTSPPSLMTAGGCSVTVASAGRPGPDVALFGGRTREGTSTSLSPWLRWPWLGRQIPQTATVFTPVPVALDNYTFARLTRTGIISAAQSFNLVRGATGWPELNNPRRSDRPAD